MGEPEDMIDRGAAGRRRSHFTEREEPPKRPWWVFPVGALAPEAAWLIARLLRSLGLFPERDYLEFSESAKFLVLACAMAGLLWLSEVVTSQGRAIRHSLRTVILFQLMAVSLYAWEKNMAPWGQVRDIEGHEGKVLQAEFSPDGSTILTLGSEGTARRWDAATHACLQAVTCIGPFASSPDGTRLATTGPANVVSIWDTALGEPPAGMAGHGGPIASVEFSPDGERLVTAGADGTVRVWNLSGVAQPTVLAGGPKTPVSVSCSPDGRIFAAGGAEGSLHFWDARSLEPAGTRMGSGGPISSIEFSTDGRRIGLASSRAPGAVRGEKFTVNLSDGKRSTLRLYRLGERSVRFSPDGRRAIVTSRYCVAIWGLRPYDILWSKKGDYVDASYSPDGNRMVTVSADGAVQVLRRQREEEAWGLLIMPEFWGLVFFATMLAWSARDDSRRYWRQARGFKERCRHETER